MTDRFYVHPAHGYKITVGHISGGSAGRSWPVAYYVLDRAMGHRAVRKFPQGETWPGENGPVAARMLKRAEGLAARLNARERKEAA